MTIAREHRLPLVIIGGAIVFVMVLHFVATTWGPLTSRDSLQYLRAAQSVTEGHGVSVSQVEDGRVVYRPLSWWPGLFPTVLAWLSMATGLTPGQAARLLHVVLLGGLIALVAATTAWAPSGIRLRQSDDEGDGVTTLWPAAAAAWLVACQPKVLRVYVHVWTEPIFVTLTLLTLLLVVRHVSRPSWKVAGLLGVLTGLAYLTRYAGMSLVVGVPLLLVVVALTSQQAQPVGRRRIVLQSGTTLLVGASFVGAWALRNVHVGARATGRKEALDVTWSERWELLVFNLETIGDQVVDWVWPDPGLGIGVGWVVGIWVVLVGMGIGLVRFRSRLRPTEVGQPSSVVPVFVLAAVGYVSFILLVKVFLDQGYADYRLMMPVQVLLLTAGVVVFSRVSVRLPRTVSLVAGVVLVGLIVGRNVDRTIGYALDRRVDEQGPTPKLSTSPVTRRLIKTLPRGAWVASYGQHSKVLAARGGYVRWRVPGASWSPDADELDRIQTAFTTDGGAFVVLDERDGEDNGAVPPEQFADLIGLVAMPRQPGDDGVIYVLDDAAPATRPATSR
ncbi:MAG: hypothetical protein AAGI46_02275 [Planctomycetota bacterium]